MINNKPSSCLECSRRFYDLSRRKGFTMTELMVTVAVLGIVSAITIVETGNAYNRDRLNEVSLLVNGWLQEISNEPDTLGQSCAVTISTGSITSGAQIASVTPTACTSTPVLRLPGTFSGMTVNVGASQATWSFTRRNAINSTNNIILRFSLNGFTSLRCVRLQAISGLVRLGSNSTTSDVVSATCNTWNAI